LLDTAKHFFVSIILVGPQLKPPEPGIFLAGPVPINIVFIVVWDNFDEERFAKFKVV